jgi:ferredoxin
MKFDGEKCGYCGACVNVCPTNSLELTESMIIIESGKCDDCGRCTIICPLGAFDREENNEI